ncbi:hypothetical protein EYF80_026514 [Liparis tanakae]|uniref:Uncharacterized protein n=1 Tax=Liparis tanakae TaxID=230148 RepID=A0A4Z2HE30_9TELE|nr:hypothetical protein EYF80_026514 [Liparis tanakae]
MAEMSVISAAPLVTGINHHRHVSSLPSHGKCGRSPVTLCFSHYRFLRSSRKLSNTTRPVGEQLAFNRLLPFLIGTKRRAENHSGLSFVL